MNKKFLLRLGASCLILALASYGLLVLFRDTLIINFGVIITNRLSGIYYILGGIGLILTIFSVPAVIRENKKLKTANQADPVLSYKNQVFSPDMIKDQLMKIKVQRPRLSKEIDNCLLQLNKMDQRQERLKEIIKLNSADYMDDSIGLLDEAEQFICKNMIRVINLSLASEDEPLDDPTYKKQVQSVLEANDKVLETCKNLLIDVANYISDKSQGQPINLTRLESWRQTVHDSITFTEK